MKPSIVQKRSLGSVKVFWLDRDRLIAELRERVLRMAREKPEVLAVYLFGSLKDGRVMPGSDADILILLDDSEKRMVDRPLEFYPLLRGAGGRG